MPAELLLADAATAEDLLVFAGRAAQAGDGALRLRARHGILVATAAPLAPAQLLDQTPTVLGLRVSRVDPELECDVVIDASTLRASVTDAAALTLPETARTASWAGISPPQADWQRAGETTVHALRVSADAGVAEVATTLPAAAGEELVQRVRAEVWGRAGVAGVAAGAAFAALALGFLPPDPTSTLVADGAGVGDDIATIWRRGPWTRLSLRRGHVIVRARTVAGLTAVRPTGSSLAAGER